MISGTVGHLEVEKMFVTKYFCIGRNKCLVITKYQFWRAIDYDEKTISPPECGYNQFPLYDIISRALKTRTPIFFCRN